MPFATREPQLKTATREVPHGERGETSGAHFDVIIVGAGLSGIGAACHLRSKCPAKTFIILEARDSIGGTWDLFRYPGIRADSDMPTFVYSFRDWDGTKAMPDGPFILEYIRDTARQFGVESFVRFSNRLIRASWRSVQSRWSLEVSGPDGAAVEMSCNFLYMCTGYYEYAAGYMPGWPGLETFRGRIAHPQAWPDDLRYDGKRIVVIGSGATAVTLVPVLAARAAHVVMLQRSPTYVVSSPSEDVIARWLLRLLPGSLARPLIRWKNISLQMYFYNLSQRKPAVLRRYVVKLAQARLGPGCDAGIHFNPRYNPYDQRFCLDRDGALFRAIRSGRASVVTDEIERITETGIRLRSGQELEADVIITATGLNMRLMGGAAIFVDDVQVDTGKTMLYKGAMYTGVPNLASAFGYTNASWNLRCDLTSDYICRLLNYMDRHGYVACTPRRDTAVEEDLALPLTSGYMQRASASLPKRGIKSPWNINRYYAVDLVKLRFCALDDGNLEFGASNATGTAESREKIFSASAAPAVPGGNSS